MTRKKYCQTNIANIFDKVHEINSIQNYQLQNLELIEILIVCSKKIYSFCVWMRSVAESAICVLSFISNAIFYVYNNGVHMYLIVRCVDDYIRPGVLCAHCTCTQDTLLTFQYIHIYVI